MKRIIIVATSLLAGLSLIAACIYFLQGANIAVLNPVGPVAREQRDLMLFATVLMLIIVVPVFAMTFFIAWKYRASNRTAEYRPDWDGNKKAEVAWWGFPLVIITVLSVVIWQSSHSLDPYRPLQSTVKPVTVQVVAMQWKWLFIYPEYDIASVNVVHFPEDTPVNFRIISDAPMNSFWIPQLGGQVYAMAGMETKLHLMAEERGVYDGTTANISGEGYADMTFKAKASSQEEFEAWVRSVRAESPMLDAEAYSTLAKPSRSVAPKTFQSDDEGMFDDIIAKYMAPMPHDGHRSGHGDHEQTTHGGGGHAH